MDEEENKVIPFVKVSNKPLNTSKPVSKKEATKAAQMILSCYPDFGKAPPEYIVNLIDLLSTYPSGILVKLCDLRTGVVSQCSFLPTIADIVKMADYWEELDSLAIEAEEKEKTRRIAAEEKANFIKAQEVKLVEARKKHPTAILDVDGRIMFFPDLEKEKKQPTPDEVEQANRATERGLLHQTRLNKYDRLN